MEAHYATIWESIADRVGDSDAIVQGTRRVTWADYERRAARLAAAFAAAGVGFNSKVALFLYNAPEYLEGYFAALKLRAVPVNVNYRYLDDELHYLLENSDSEVVVFHSSLGERIAHVRQRLPLLRRWIEVADDAQHLDGAERYEEVVAAAVPAAHMARSADDIAMVYTGGTTGMPKGVMTRIGGGVLAGLAGLAPMLGIAAPAPEEVATVAAQLAADGRRSRSLVPCPLMHGTGLGIGSHPTMLLGGCTVLVDGRRFDPREIWDVAERERVTGITVVGDAFARPLARTLDEDRRNDRRRDLSSLQIMASAGAMFSREVKDALVEHLPQLTIVDLIAATEGGMGMSVHSRKRPAATASFRVNPGTRVMNEDGHPVAPGSGEIGMVALSGTVPLGYYKDPEKSARTFREIDGVRWSFPGDFATVEADGTITLLGRGSQVINTGGEKVFAEEVEEVLKRHPAVEDCLVVGVADERFGQRVAAVVALHGSADEVQLIAHAKGQLAAFKAPKQIVLVAQVPRAPNGKADYKRARELVMAAG